MGMGKGAYLKRITSGTVKWRTVDIGEKMDGTSPPSVFIGQADYPKVQVGPMMAPFEGHTEILDTPESWIPMGKTQEDIIQYRLNLVRGKHRVDIKDVEGNFVRKLQEISLAEYSVESEAQFKYKPRGVTFDEEHQPYGPSAQLKSLDLGNVRWERHLEKVYYDTDWKANDALGELYRDGVLFSQMQKAFSTGTMGIGKNRKLVPTRWSITAVDSALGKKLYDEVKYHDIIDSYHVYEFSSLNNYYAVILTPTPWQYEWTEAFIHILGSEEMIFSDFEMFKPKKEYSSVGGCYYTAKFAVLEALARMKKQAGAVILREAYENYIPLGVFNVRENIRSAMKQPHREFGTMRDSLNYVSTRLKLPLSRFIEQGPMLRDLLEHRQTTLA
jgi:hypothetical protein